jgi:CPA2 family monovalent cation:H+ antiporter-2
MEHGPPLLATLVVALTLACVFGVAARLLRLPPLIGYLVAGVFVGPHTPGFAADVAFTQTLAEVGVGLLLFGVGLHFKARDLIAVWRMAVPGALLQVIAGTVIGAGVGMAALELDFSRALVFGLALAIASTAVATRALEERGILSNGAGRIALGWLVMQDLIVVLALVLVPVAGGSGGGGASLLAGLGRAVVELVVFTALMFIVGRRALPFLLSRIARTGSRELFTLAVVVAAIGVAFAAATAFGVSFALGAFFAGVVLGESDLGHQAAAETVPLQRIFAALFFVSVGMLLDPAALAEAPLADIAALLAVFLGTGVITFLLLLLLGAGPRTAATVGAALAQIGEFSFVLAEVAIKQGILEDSARGPILLAAFGAILLNPVTFRVFAWAADRLEHMPRFAGMRAARVASRAMGAMPALHGHAILVGYGRVGSVIAAALRRHNLPILVIEDERNRAEQLRRDSIPVIWGDASQAEVLHAAHPEKARLLIVTVPYAWQAREIIEQARHANPKLQITLRAHDEEEAAMLARESGGMVVMGEREIALGMADFALQRLGVGAGTAQATIDVLRARISGQPIPGEG